MAYVALAIASPLWSEFYSEIPSSRLSHGTSYHVTLAMGLQRRNVTRYRFVSLPSWSLPWSPYLILHVGYTASGKRCWLKLLLTHRGLVFVCALLLKASSVYTTFTLAVIFLCDMLASSRGVFWRECVLFVRWNWISVPCSDRLHTVSDCLLMVSFIVIEMSRRQQNDASVSNLFETPTHNNSRTRWKGWFLE